MEIIEVIFLTLAIFLVIVSTISVICLFRVNKKIKARPINEDLLFTISRYVESRCKDFNKNIPFDDKIEIIAESYNHFIKDYCSFCGDNGFYKGLDLFIGSRVFFYREKSISPL